MLIVKGNEVSEGRRFSNYAMLQNASGICSQAKQIPTSRTKTIFAIEIFQDQNIALTRFIDEKPISFGRNTKIFTYTSQGNIPNILSVVLFILEYMIVSLTYLEYSSAASTS
jgi:hypothetical protein